MALYRRYYEKLKKYKGGLFDCHIDPELTRIMKLSDRELGGVFSSKPMIDYLIYRKPIPEVVESCSNNPILNYPDGPVIVVSDEDFGVCREYTRYRLEFSKKGEKPLHPNFPPRELHVVEGIEFESVGDLDYLTLGILEFEPIKIPIKERYVKFPFPFIEPKMYDTYVSIRLYNKKGDLVEFGSINSWLIGGMLRKYPFEQIGQLDIPFEASGKKYIAHYSDFLGIELLN
jgi:hypothetical protein